MSMNIYILRLPWDCSEPRALSSTEEDASESSLRWIYFVSYIDVLYLSCYCSMALPLKLFTEFVAVVSESLPHIFIFLQCVAQFNVKLCGPDVHRDSNILEFDLVGDKHSCGGLCLITLICKYMSVLYAFQINYQDFHFFLENASKLWDFYLL